MGGVYGKEAKRMGYGSLSARMQHDEEEIKEHAAGSTNPDLVIPDEVNK